VLDVKRGSGAKEGTSAAAAAAAGKDADDGIPTPLSMAVRPLRAVPGFDGELTCCRDWPQTKKGEHNKCVAIPLVEVHVGIDMRIQVYILSFSLVVCIDVFFFFSLSFITPRCFGRILY
jgi:hypothetical protein